MRLFPSTHPAFATTARLPNRWDLAVLICVFGALVVLAQTARSTLVPLDAPEAVAIYLDPTWLPYYALRTTLRMFAAILASLLFALLYAAAAAKSRRAALVMVPALDILQSVPILGFLSFTVVFFMNLFPGRVLGLELAAIFAIFTSQAWNMAFSLYQSFSNVPAELREAARSFRLSPWQRFWRVEVAFGIPGLVWNTMISMSGGWFFVVAAEAISVGDQNWKLPGIGSFVALALEQRDIGAVMWTIVTMLAVILAYDQLLFRPLVAWSTKFRVDDSPAATIPEPWLLRLLRRTRLLRRGGEAFGQLLTNLGGMRLAGTTAFTPAGRQASPLGDVVFAVALTGVVGFAAWHIAALIAADLGLGDVLTALGLGCLTLLRVMLLMVLASLIWVPIGVWLGLRPVWARRAQPVALFFAAFPANLLFPPVVLLIVHYDLYPEIWLSPLMMLGPQWYILFNIVAGASVLPRDLLLAAQNFRVGGWLWWRRVMLPGIFPYYVTSAITASGGAWNAAIVAEVVSWGDVRLKAHGLGAYIADATVAGDLPRVVLGVAMMCSFVLLVNRLVWRPMHEYASRRLTFD
ncbi:MAG: ABC transporter permease subunit [Acetobacteraceae bacterium]|nr:ABC transporter permease subunit [Acetobacteraceae bacterium]